MSERIPYVHQAPIRALFFDRIKTLNWEMIGFHSDMAQEIASQNSDAILLLLGEIESRIQTIRHILAAFEECVER